MLKVERLPMISHRVFSTFAAGAFFVSVTSSMFAQDLSKTILPITDFKVTAKKKSISPSTSWSALLSMAVPALETDLGTGFCLDPECRFIGTNYHVAAIARPHKIKRDEVIQRYLATGPDDEGATTNELFSEQAHEI